MTYSKYIVQQSVQSTVESLHNNTVPIMIMVKKKKNLKLNVQAYKYWLMNKRNNTKEYIMGSLAQQVHKKKYICVNIYIFTIQKYCIMLKVAKNESLSTLFLQNITKCTMISDYPIKILPNSFALYIFWQTIGIHDYNYTNALIFSAIARPSSGLTGSCFILFNSRIVFGSLRKSFLLPTNIIGTFGQKCFTSGVHFSGIFSNESGESMEKHMRITSVSG
ncbi:hypothetical protein AGLY_004610 [Aphis glycines]|uniref:Uncharacterized protein n=1 Tax=Aphis glycines TaxID=307491 RepID=A0A6G0TUD6_APHGL|nr:hypothetical protein AGLY_004610 [Aphis glycines]